MKRIEFQVEDEQYEVIKKEASEVGVSIGAYIRAKAISQEKEDDTRAVFKKEFSDFQIALKLILQENIREPAAQTHKGTLKAPVPPSYTPTGRISDADFRRAKYLESGQWEIRRAPDGSVDGYFSEDHNAIIKVIQDARGNQEILFKTDPLYEEF